MDNKLDTPKIVKVDMPVETHSMVVMAKTADEMQVASSQIIIWVDHKLLAIDNELKDLQDNLEIAKKSKWKTSSWKSRITREQKKKEYYEKIKAIVEAGYTIVPDFPFDVFAVRTTAKKPKGTKQTGWRQDHTQHSNQPPAGEGEYVSSTPLLEFWTETKVNNDGSEKEIQASKAVEFDAVDFPFGFAKAQILSDTKKAMALKLFDEIGAVRPPRRRGDPIIVGRVQLGNGYNPKRLHFLISWFMDLRDI